jgi:hypothetical protein
MLGRSQALSVAWTRCGWIECDNAWLDCSREEASERRNDSRRVILILTELTGMDRSALSKLETGQRANPTMETFVRYAEAVGKRLVFSLADAVEK